MDKQDLIKRTAAFMAGLLAGAAGAVWISQGPVEGTLNPGSGMTPAHGGNGGGAGAGVGKAAGTKGENSPETDDIPYDANTINRIVNPSILYKEVIDNILSKINSVTEGNLSNVTTEVIRLARSLPEPVKSDTLQHYFGSVAGKASFDDLRQLMLNPPSEVESELSRPAAFGDSSWWGGYLQLFTSRVRRMGRIDELSAAAQKQFLEGAGPQRLTSQRLAASMLLTEGSAGIDARLAGYDGEFRAAVHAEMIDSWSRQGKNGGLRFLLETDGGTQADEKDVEKIMDPVWFTENANRLSRMIADSRPSKNKDLIISKMVNILMKTDPRSAREWAGNIQDESIRTQTMHELGGAGGSPDEN